MGDIRSFKREHELVPDEGGNGDEGVAVPAGDEELDLRAEDDARVAAALEAEQEEDEEEEEEESRRPRPPATAMATPLTTTSPSAAAAGAAAVAGAGARPRSSRGPSTTATRATAYGSIRRSRTIPSMPSTGRATGP